MAGLVHRIRCGKCNHWLANTSGSDFFVEIKCPQCRSTNLCEVAAGELTVRLAQPQAKGVKVA